LRAWIVCWVVALASVGANEVLGGRSLATADRFEAFEALYAAHHDDVYRYVRSFATFDEAEDIVSDVFARGFAAWRDGREPNGPPLPWLLLIARRLLTDRWRRARRILWGQLPSRGPVVDPQSDRAEMEFQDWLASLARVLTYRQREALALRYLGRLNDDEIGRVLGLSASGVRSLVSRALVILRTHEELWR
jgi:RNA polymerase sigma factor (sigma-70 family)